MFLYVLHPSAESNSSSNNMASYWDNTVREAYIMVVTIEAWLGRNL
jgi:hypothetical protein